jgi:threonine-phosphate decarboxylase
MYEYTHGGNIYDENGHTSENIIDFSANINPLGIPEEAIIAATISLAKSNIYPDSNCRLLTSKIAEFEEVDKSNILCSNGASDILFRLVYSMKPKKILVTAPSFADYERAGKAVEAEIIYYNLKKENNFNIDKDIIDNILKASPDIVFICNPNNPTCNLTDIGIIAEIAEACKSANSLLLADECFLDFVFDSHKYSAKFLIDKYKNIVILKAFTKIFAMPGLRLGYAICDDTDLIDRMRFCGADWAVSNIAQEAGIAALANGREYIEKSIIYVNMERKRLIDELINLGLIVYSSYANFIFFHCPQAVDLCGELRKKNIIIRDCSNFKGLEPGYYRTAVLTKEKNELLIKEVKELWRNQ